LLEQRHGVRQLVRLPGASTKATARPISSVITRQMAKPFSRASLGAKAAARPAKPAFREAKAPDLTTVPLR